MKVCKESCALVANQLVKNKMFLKNSGDIDPSGVVLCSSVLT